MKTLIIENTWLTRGIIDFGWGNGYVLIPKGHFLHSLSYDEINNMDISVHGGLTFSCAANELSDWNIPEEDKDAWVVGFDTAHYRDNAESWPKERVQEEADRLMEQLQALSPLTPSQTI